jgi:3-oxoacyl-[acyl-carrier protein] reductase
MSPAIHEGKVAFVTGSGRGLGREYALHLARLGCDVVVHDIDDAAPSRFGEAESLEQTVEEIRAMGRRAMAVTADVTQFDQIREAMQKVARTWGRIDYCINNAGGDIGKRTPRPDPNDGVSIQTEDVEWVIAINLTGTIHSCRAVAPIMMEQGFGRIVNVSSSAAFAPVDVGLVYAAAKAGIVHYTRSLARQLKKYNITVNAIAPGPTVGGRFLATRHVPKELLERTSGLDRLGRPLDQAKVIEFLISPLADYVSGQTIVVDGG